MQHELESLLDANLFINVKEWKSTANHYTSNIIVIVSRDSKEYLLSFSCL